MQNKITRRAHLAALIGAPAIFAKENNDNMFQQILEASMNEKKGVNLYVRGQAIAGVVTKINADSVEMRSREYSRIVVKLDSIDAAAMS